MGAVSVIMASKSTDEMSGQKAMVVDSPFLTVKSFFYGFI